MLRAYQPRRGYWSHPLIHDYKAILHYGCQFVKGTRPLDRVCLVRDRVQLSTGYSGGYPIYQLFGNGPLDVNHILMDTHPPVALCGRGKVLRWLPAPAKVLTGPAHDWQPEMPTVAFGGVGFQSIGG